MHFITTILHIPILYIAQIVRYKFLGLLFNIQFDCIKFANPINSINFLVYKHHKLI